MTQWNRQRTIAAFVVAPLIVPFVFLLPFPGRTNTGPLDFRTLLAYSIYALPIAYLAESSLGILVWKIFTRYDIRSLPAFAVAGALMGWVVSVVLQGVAGNLGREHLRNLFDPSSTPYLLLCIVNLNDLRNPSKHLILNRQNAAARWACLKKSALFAALNLNGARHGISKVIHSTVRPAFKF